MGEPLVLTDDEGPIWTVTINLPHKRNALDHEDRCALVAALGRADESDGCRAVVLTGAALDVEIMEFYSVAGGKVTGLDVFYQDTKAVHDFVEAQVARGPA